MSPSVYLSNPIANFIWNKSRYTSGTAWVDFISGIIHGAYASSGYVAVHIDSAGKVAWAYLGAAGTGEAFGSNLLSNAAFNDTTGVTAVDSSIASVAGGQAGNCLQVTIADGKTMGYATQTFDVTPYRAYRARSYVKKGTGVSVSLVLLDASNEDAVLLPVELYTDADWALKTIFFVAPASCTSVKLAYRVAGIGGQIGLFDTTNASLVTTSGSSSVLAYKDAALLSVGWNMDAGFNPCAIVSAWVVRQT